MRSRRWRHGDPWRRTLPGLLLGLFAATVNAACPPCESDGTVIMNGPLALAYQPVIAGKASRIPMARHFTLEVQLCDKDGVSAALLKNADATMPEHRHGMNYRPVITPLGDGRFRVEGMMFHMAGHWELVFEVQAGKTVTRLTHDVQID